MCACVTDWDWFKRMQLGNGLTYSVEITYTSGVVTGFYLGDIKFGENLIEPLQFREIFKILIFFFQNRFFTSHTSLYIWPYPRSKINWSFVISGKKIYDIYTKLMHSPNINMRFFAINFGVNFLCVFYIDFAIWKKIKEINFLKGKFVRVGRVGWKSSATRKLGQCCRCCWVSRASFRVPSRRGSTRTHCN